MKCTCMLGTCLHSKYCIHLDNQSTDFHKSHMFRKLRNSSSHMHPNEPSNFDNSIFQFLAHAVLCIYFVVKIIIIINIWNRCTAIFVNTKLIHVHVPSAFQMLHSSDTHQGPLPLTSQCIFFIPGFSFM